MKVTEVQITAEEQLEIAGLFKRSDYESLLNVMERACISLESALINAPVGSPEEILGAHAVTKAAWLFFNYVQNQVYAAYTRQMQEAPDEPEPNLADMIQSVEGMPMVGDPDQGEGE